MYKASLCSHVSEVRTHVSEDAKLYYINRAVSPGVWRKRQIYQDKLPQSVVTASFTTKLVISIGSWSLLQQDSEKNLLQSGNRRLAKGDWVKISSRSQVMASYSPADLPDSWVPSSSHRDVGCSLFQSGMNADNTSEGVPAQYNRFSCLDSTPLAQQRRHHFPSSTPVFGTFPPNTTENSMDPYVSKFSQMHWQMSGKLDIYLQ